MRAAPQNSPALCDTAAREDKTLSQPISSTSLTDRMLRAARLDVALYNEVEADLTATSQALSVVVLTAVASGLGYALGAAFGGRPERLVGGMIGGVLVELLGWAVWSFIMYFVGTRFFGGTATYGELLRTLGFAYTPGVLLILRFLPVLGGLIGFAVFIWRIITGFIAVREALDVESGKAVATIVIGFIGYLIVLAVVGAIFATLGFGAALLTGAFN
jgi:hypothetical protein